MTKISFDKIDPNPARDLINNPLRQEQIDHLAASVESTGFWDNVLVRPHPKRRGRYQLAYGHARIEAARRSGIKTAEFAVRELSDEDMIRIMASENVTQFGKDSFATYKEATIAAATHIIREVLADTERAQKFLSPDARRDDKTKFCNEIQAGGCPGEPVIAEFFGGTLNVADIRLALQTFRETGELAAWHKEHNPQAKRTSAATIDPEAIAKFERSDHVRAFVDTVKTTKIPLAKQKPLADQIARDLTDHQQRKREAKPRRSYDSTVPANERLTSANIRRAVAHAAYDSARSDADRARTARIEAMTTAESSLDTVERGLSRTVAGFRSLREIIEVCGSVEAELSPLAMEKLHRIRGHFAELQKLMAECGTKLTKIGAPQWKTH